MTCTETDLVVSKKQKEDEKSCHDDNSEARVSVSRHKAVCRKFLQTRRLSFISGHIPYKIRDYDDNDDNDGVVDDDDLFTCVSHSSVFTIAGLFFFYVCLLGLFCLFLFFGDLFLPVGTSA